MQAAAADNRKKFYLELIKPSHYDDDGYVIQWFKAWIPSNSLACLYAIGQAMSEDGALGDDTEIVVNPYDEVNTVIPIKKMARRMKANGNRGLVCMVGVQSNQFPRAMDMARQLRKEGIQVAIGGFHVSGCLSMLKELPADIQEAIDLGISIFAGEAEEHFAEVLTDADQGKLKPIYNYMSTLPSLQDQLTPFLPDQFVHKYDGSNASFDAGRGCPFQCSFCTIINVQGRVSRYRSADDIEKIIRVNYAQGITRYFISDDNFARNRNWEAIFDRMIELRENEGIPIRFIIQVDVLAHKTKNFIEKAERAGCKRVFIGLENINPANLEIAKKGQNRITEYRTMLQKWRAHGIISYAGYILGFPVDTPETIRRDIEIIQKELPVDLLGFTNLTPLPGSEDHKVLTDMGVWMDPDMNKYDLEHVTTAHPLMSPEEWDSIYREAWDLYYTEEHIERMMRRAVASGIKPHAVMINALQLSSAMRYERVHPQQCGYVRRKVRRQRRSTLPLENPLTFYPKYLLETVIKYSALALYVLRINRMRKRIQNDPASKSYTDVALTPVEEAEAAEEHLEMFELNDSARAAVAKARHQAEAKAKHEAKKKSEKQVAAV
ncbi:radical SAM protein [Pelagibius sp. Alg239-R121]|uniref:B12-binding domain-containing radical SAM protein n=1 Tax=Pelagibius sp. Alg239-R121 TaxID=2993448 RepID=UPI0024A6C183|nr:radical SAM protein [Pelagibius sp. Alg239-R121]